jgi:ABC-type glycerol-3-phosphate transport system substrate-binding protein
MSKVASGAGRTSMQRAALAALVLVALTACGSDRKNASSERPKSASTAAAAVSTTTTTTTTTTTAPETTTTKPCRAGQLLVLP